MLFFVTVFAQEPDSSSHVRAIRANYRALKELRFDPSRVAGVKELRLTRDRATFFFSHGKFYFSESVDGKVTGAVFVGDGRLNFMPPNRIERQQVLRFLEKERVEEEFEAAYIRFTDGTWEELSSQLQFVGEAVPDRITRLHEKIHDYFLKERGFNLTSSVLTDLLDPASPGFFISVLEQEQPGYNFPGYLVFAFDPQAGEEVSLLQFFPNRAEKPFYTVCSFHEMGDYAPDDSLFSHREEEPDRLRISHYNLDVSLQKNGEIEVASGLAVVPAKDSLLLLDFVLYQELEVDSVKNAVGDTLAFIQEEKEAGFSIILDAPMPAGSEQQLTVYYSGKAMAASGSNVLLKDKVHWYPRHGYLEPATYRITYRYPRKWEVISVGKRMQTWEEAGQSSSSWQLEIPSFAAAFALGYFDSTGHDNWGEWPVIVYSNRGRTGGMRKKIGGDVANSLYFFESLLGGYPYGELNVTETPGLASQGFPGILFLTSLTFSQEFTGPMEALRAHEVAHQWWGNLIGWQTYHDQWLSEGLAEYSGALVTEFVLQDQKQFDQVVEGWRTDLLDKGHIGVSLGLRSFGFSKQNLAESQGLEAGPIWLGRRLGSKYPIDYHLITYEKAAYMLHMLRFLTRDHDSGDDTRFWRMLADFAEKNRGRRAETRDFIRVVQDHSEEDMTWFFDQWLFGTDVPTYLYSHELSHSRNAVTLHVRQEDVPDGFQMVVPVTLILENGDRETTQVRISRPEQTFEFGPFADTVKEVVFNDRGAVLARVKRK